MSGHWNFYQLLIDDEPASIFVDLGIADVAPLAAFPTLAFLRVRMNEFRPDGLSSQDEFDRLVALEDDLCETLSRDGRSLYVGRATSGGNRDFYVYTHDPSVENALEGLMARWPDYAFETGSRADFEWSVYWRFLHPSPADWQRIANRGVVDALLAKGDRIDCPRQIDHLAFFATEEDRDGFARDLMAEGYRLSPPAGAVDGQFPISFHRIDRPDQIDEMTIRLDQAARNKDGRYDGWSCHVVDAHPVQTELGTKGVRRSRRSASSPPFSGDRI